MYVNNRCYTVERLLGKGKGGYSYLVTDGEGQYVLKQIHHEPCSYYQFGNKLESELRDYDRLMQLGIPMPAMLDVDVGRERILKEYICGDTVYDLVRRGSLPDTCIPQVQAMCRRLYPANTNIDYFPTNFILQDGTLYYIDYECNDYMEQWNFENWGAQYWSRTETFLQYEKEHSQP
ncbi:MAG: hypothetical protein Q4F17_02475 [Eubacteriales bacterium]|nr:hypothetical protein [Eubacteriales bacterium]